MTPLASSTPGDGNPAMNAMAVESPSLTDLLTLDLGPDGSTRTCPSTVTAASARMFGGQLVAQALAAGAQTTADGMLPISLHGLFLRPGDASVPVGYRVEEGRDGRAFSSRSVRAIQGDRVLAMFTTLWQRPEQWTDHDDPSLPPPRPSASQELPYRAPGVLTGALDLRWVDAPCGRGLWFQPRTALPPDPVLHACVASYVSDLWLLDTLLRRHGHRFDDPGIRASSLDYCAWIHREIRLDGWTYLGSTTPVAAGGRGLVEAVLRTEAGVRVATIHQDVSVRLRREQPESDMSSSTPRRSPR